jgi:hypothetical protein
MMRSASVFVGCISCSVLVGGGYSVDTCGLLGFCGNEWFTW